MAAAFLFLCAGLVALSLLSGYSVRDVGTVSWEVVLMLTPAGMIRNLLLVPDHFLRPYYGEVAYRARAGGDPAVLGAIALVWGSAVWGLILLRRRRMS